VHKQRFSCKINCTKVKQTAIKLHKVHMKDTGPGVGVYFKWEIPTLTPGLKRTLGHSDSNSTPDLSAVWFYQGSAKILNCDKSQDSILNLDKVLNSLIYRSSFCVTYVHTRFTNFQQCTVFIGHHVCMYYVGR